MVTTVRRRRTAAVAVVFLAAVAVAIALIVIGVREPAASAATDAPVPTRNFDVTAVVDPPVSGGLPMVDPSSGLAQTSAHSPAPRSAGREQQPPGPILDDRLVIPAIGVNAVTVANPLTNGSLALPDQVNTLTRWDGSADIHADTGTILVAGHVDNRTQGQGALYWMHTLQPGDALYLSHDEVVTRWKTVALKSYPKQALPQKVWAGSSGPRTLMVVTCGGEFHNGHYDDNVVLTAVPF